MVLVKLIEVLKDVRFHIRHQVRIAPEFIEPGFQIATVTGAVHLQVQFDVVVADSQPETADGEIGTAKNGFFHSAVGDVIHLAVEQLGVADGSDVHLLANPLGALAGDALLLQTVGQLKTACVEDERFLLRLLGVERIAEPRFAEQEVAVLDLVEVLLQGVIRVNGEIG
jgi:hypothetical protein